MTKQTSNFGDSGNAVQDSMCEQRVSRSKGRTREKSQNQLVQGFLSNNKPSTCLEPPEYSLQLEQQKWGAEGSPLLP